MVKKFFKTSGWILLFLAIYMAAQSIIGIFAGLLIVFSKVLDLAGSSRAMDQAGMTQEITNSIMHFTPVILLLSIAVSFPFYLLITRLRREKMRDICHVRALPVKTILFLVMTGASASILLSLGLGFVRQISALDKYFSAHEKLTQSLFGGNIVLTFLVIGVMVPIFEEVLFRGLVLNELRRYAPLTACVILQGLLFGLYHFNLVQGSYAFILGVVFGLAYLWTRSFLAPVILHILLNSISTLMSRIPGFDIPDILAVGLVGASAGIFALGVFLLWWNRNKVKTGLEAGFY